MTLRRVDKSPESQAKGALDPERYTAALERALHETLLALVALSQQKQELTQRLRDIHRLAVQSDASPDAVQQIRRVLYDLSIASDDAPTAGGIA